MEKKMTFSAKKNEIKRTNLIRLALGMGWHIPLAVPFVQYTSSTPLSVVNNTIFFLFQIVSMRECENDYPASRLRDLANYRSYHTDFRYWLSHNCVQFIYW